MTSPGSDLAAMRRTVQAFCGYCGERITGTVRKKYCNDSCRASEANRRKAKKKRRSSAAAHPSD